MKQPQQSVSNLMARSGDYQFVRKAKIKENSQIKIENMPS
jgi:hypothetical protein